MGESHKNGYRLESDTKDIIEEVIVSLKADAEVVYHPLTIGSTNWYPDIVVRTRNLFELPGEHSLNLAIIECKYTDETSSEGSYWSQMSRAYMSLNDMRLAEPTLKFYLVVNRGGKSKIRNYSKVFNNINVSFVNLNVQEELSGFKSSVKQLLEENSWDKQLQVFKQVLKRYQSPDNKEVPHSEER